MLYNTKSERFGPSKTKPKPKSNDMSHWRPNPNDLGHPRPNPNQIQISDIQIQTKSKYLVSKSKPKSKYHITNPNICYQIQNQIQNIKSQIQTKSKYQISNPNPNPNQIQNSNPNPNLPKQIQSFGFVASLS
ncbi:unnamed protein product [Rotaria socialis]|uniref:Uncharacterized protein n=1 Tax=Rotaria socialis TaxID=392032 RepID=A0A821NE20_9BILA|nr:unnamed protein product [Rotaria socialis]CAF4783064.1 unnamed protein product [Rotaria socialis]